MTHTTQIAGPLDALAELGVTVTPWAENESSRTDSTGTLWHYYTPYINTQSLRDLAWLTTLGWSVTVSKGSKKLSIRIRRNAQKAVNP